MNKYELEDRSEKLLKRVGSTGELYFDEKVLSKEVVENVPENYMLSYYSDLGDYFVMSDTTEAATKKEYMEVVEYEAPEQLKKEGVESVKVFSVVADVELFDEHDDDCSQKEKAFKIFVDMSFTTKNGETA